MRKSLKWYSSLLLMAPAVLLFSYFPVISFGADEAMHFELSLPLIWLVVFDLFTLCVLARLKKLNLIFGKWQYLLFPIFASLSILWSYNKVRGFLTVGVLWLLVFAGLGILVLKDEFDDHFKKRFWKIFFGTSVVVGVWCILQCILDVLNVPREQTLLCRGCISQAFGFPHPNGFAIEPQFMGNLMLAPTIASAVFFVKSRKRLHGLMFLFFSSIVFLTFSRGAIYATTVALIFFVVLEIVKTKKWQSLMLFPIFAVAFVIVLNAQGILAAVSPTNDTYISGVAKAVNHLSLGIIDFRAKETPAESSEPSENKSDFDGYVEESTEVRKGLTNSAIRVWRKDFKTAMFGVGIGGAGEALYRNGETDWPKEIVQNEYASLLIETGLIGVALIAVAVFYLVKGIMRNAEGAPLVLTLFLGYGITLVFFSGLPNALHIYLLPVLFYVNKK